jgi:hypothetical protein
MNKNEIGNNFAVKLIEEVEKSKIENLGLSETGLDTLTFHASIPKLHYSHLLRRLDLSLNNFEDASTNIIECFTFTNTSLISLNF